MNNKPLIEPYKRRCGNTTRQVDQWVQDLFNGEKVVIWDHAQRDGNDANRHAEIVFLRRLKIEHGLEPGRSSMLQYSKDGKYYFLVAKG